MHTTLKSQSGVSLVEMMIAITIGLLLVLGLGTVFVSVSQTSKARLALSGLQNNERMAIMFLNTAVHNAGYIATPAAVNNFISLPALSVTALTGTGSATAGTDTLTVGFIADSSASLQGCTANLTAGHVYTDAFSVSAGYLTCTETDTTAGTTTTVNLVGGSPTAVPPVASLSGMNIVYGVDVSSPPSGSVTKYLTGNAVTALGATYWQNYVKTVKITLIFANPMAGQSGQPATVTIAQTIRYMNGS